MFIEVNLKETWLKMKKRTFSYQKVNKRYSWLSQRSQISLVCKGNGQENFWKLDSITFFVWNWE